MPRSDRKIISLSKHTDDGFADDTAMGLSPSGGTEKTLVPNLAYAAAFFITFAIPNLVFSGPRWFDTLHIMKWFVTMTPVGIVTVLAGFNLFRNGAEKTNFAVDPFAIAWLCFILLISSQPIFIRLTSKSTFVKEWFFFATLFAVYLLAYNMPPKNGFFRVLLWGSSLNASINVLFAELVVRGIKTGLPFIMDVPGNYIGNTAQQEMLGLWMAMAIFNCLFLHVSYAREWGTNKRSRVLLPLNLFFMAVNAWGLWNSTSRGGILAFMTGFVVIVISFACSNLWKPVKQLCGLFGVVLMFLILVLTADFFAGGVSRARPLVTKMLDMVRNPGTFGGRIAIWAVSGEVFKEHPISGVGLGHYKWHFLDGQRALYEKRPELLDTPSYKWQFTYWAHSEYLQWLCEVGLIGSIPMLALGLWWLYLFLKALAARRQMPPEAIWGAGMLFLLFFDAMFSRPFHRIENAVWMSLAFAQVNGFLLPHSSQWLKRESEAVYRASGVFMATAAVCGLLFLGGGMFGDKLMLRAVFPGSDEAKRGYLERAGKFLMSRDDALEQMAKLNISIGEWDDEAYLRGVRELYVAFKMCPNSERLFKLFECARKLNNAALMKELIPYFPPGSVGLR
ncbi:MAG: O-antigen ligase family protein [Synergistaceae bacterium]|nr:O-antigen ligase family protein [Synergistaceae bacterium]